MFYLSLNHPMPWGVFKGHLVKDVIESNPYYMDSFIGKYIKTVTVLPTVTEALKLRIHQGL